MTEEMHYGLYQVFGDPAHLYFDRNGEITRLRNPHPQEAIMNPYDEYVRYPYTRPIMSRSEVVVPPSMAEQLRRMVQGLSTPFKPLAQMEAERRENKFRSLDVQNGDVLTLEKGDSVLQGKVTQIRERDGESQVRIEGFDESPHGTQNVWFGVRNYDSIKVGNRAFRWTDRDKVIVALLGSIPERWEKSSQADRDYVRGLHGAKADRILAAIKAESEWAHKPTA